MGRENKIVGALGEKKALEFLRREGYKILGTNIRTQFGELDAVAKKRGMIAFIEIKTRLTDSLGPPSLSVTWSKKRSLVNNALSYLHMNGLAEPYWRIDVVSVKLRPDYEVERIEIITNAVEGNY